MKKLLLGSAGLAVLIAGPAIATDMQVKAPAPVAYYDWSGAYIGFNAGGVWHQNSLHFPTPGAAGLGVAGVNPDFSTNDGDGIFGFHAGAQWQWGAWVLGVEAALSGCMRECRGNSGALPAPYFAPNSSFETKMTNLFTVGPRLGYAFDRWMIFATGGWASANLKGSALLDHHQRLQPAGLRLQRRVAQRRLVCRRRHRLHGPQGPAGRCHPRRRISALRCARTQCVL
jgi:outer membrane immunogenic protein